MSVAIRAITRLQDADDVNVTLGAGVDEYALTWDNDTAKFVLRAPAAAFAGILATGATVGATSQAQAFTVGVVSPFSAPAADSTTAWQVRKADKTTSVLNVDTTNARVGIGLANPDNTFSVVGAITVLHTSDMGNAAGVYLGTSQAALGGDIEFRTTDRSSRGRIRSEDIGGGPGYMGFWVADASSALRQYARITSAGLVGIGTTAPATLLHGLLTSAATNAVTNVVTIGHDTTGTAAAGFGAGLLFALESSTTAAQSAARIQALWYEATHATRKADLVLTAYDTAEREGLRIRGAGSAAAIGFLGAAPAARIAHVADPAGGATVDAEARSAINSILTTLETFGFHATS